MVGASLYILYCTTRNRTRRWLKRLREPRYSIAVVLGAAYLWFIVGAQSRRRSANGEAGRRASAVLLQQFPALAVVGPALAGFGLTALAAASWLIPGSSGLLDFSRAEGQFLFTAPVSMRQLLVHRIIRSQLGLLFGPLVFAVLVPFGSSPDRVRMAITLWIALFTARMYFSGAAVARASLRGSGLSHRLSRLFLAAVYGALLTAAVPLGRTLFFGAPLGGPGEAMRRIADVVTRPGVHAALWPATALVRPAFVSNWNGFLSALPAALAVSGAVVVWVLVNAPAVEDIIKQAAEQPVDRPQKKKAAYRARRIFWKLSPEGRAETVFAWKSAVQTFRIAEVRILIRLSFVFVWIAFVSSMQNNAAAALGAAAMIAATICTLFGPLILRIDLRQDLAHLEVLKTWPVGAPALMRGEMLWPAILLSTIVWILTATAFSMSQAVFSTADTALRASLAVSFAFVAPAVITTQLAIHNSVALIFPAWVSFGNWRSRGVDAMGQRLIVVGGTMLLVTLAAIPGVLLGGIAWLALNRFIGPIAFIPAAALCALAMFIEVLFVSEAIGPAYERIDLSSVESSEQ
ncbi:MAG TPA: putative ABC exporter domain-containing protein [Vicinamibacterales bacterium]|nr:putative ABC exporter domain-containing protein [Vicinamibacterales bacterium]